MQTITLVVNRRQYDSIQEGLERYYSGVYETSVSRFRNGTARLTILHDAAIDDTFFERILRHAIRDNATH